MRFQSIRLRCGRRLVGALIALIAASAPLHAQTWAESFNAIPRSGQGTWETTLQARDLDGDKSTAEAYYDTDLNISWLADANVIIDPVAGINHYNGLVNFNDAVFYTNLLNINGLYGLSGWRLPKLTAADQTAAGELDCRGLTYQGGACGYNVDPGSSEIAHLFHTTLGNVAIFPPDSLTNPDWQTPIQAGLRNSGPFKNYGGLDQNKYPSPFLWTPNYWMSNSALRNRVWGLEIYAGGQFAYPVFRYKTPIVSEANKVYTENLIWLVHDGDIGTPVPEPTTAALTLLGLGALALRARRRHLQNTPKTKTA
jgi:PEP-CTERM motif